MALWESDFAPSLMKKMNCEPSSREREGTCHGQLYSQLDQEGFRKIFESFGCPGQESESFLQSKILACHLLSKRLFRGSLLKMSSSVLVSRNEWMFYPHVRQHSISSRVCTKSKRPLLWLYSSGFAESEEEHNSENLSIRFDVASVKKEITRGKRLTCSSCHKNGATVGCEIKSCRRNYHYICALRGHAIMKENKQEGIYCVFCPNHDPDKKSSSHDEGSTNGMPPTLTKSSSTTNKMNDETAEEENMQVLRRKDDPHKAWIEYLKKCKEAGLLDKIFDDMLGTLHLAQKRLMDDNTSEAEYEETVRSLLDYGLFENILTAAHSGKEKKIQELMNKRERLDAQIELLKTLKNFKETVLPVSEDSASTSSNVYVL